MTREQQRIRIAETCGWRRRWQNCGGAPLLNEKPKGHCWEVWTDSKGNSLDKNHDELFPPDYLNDLNAMHEAEKSLTDIDDWLLYDKALAETTSGFTYHATARHRAEAFLRVLGLWED